MVYYIKAIFTTQCINKMFFFINKLTILFFYYQKCNFRVMKLRLKFEITFKACIFNWRNSLESSKFEVLV